MPARHRPYRLTPGAERDLEDIWTYTFRMWSAAQADKYHAGIVAAFQSLASGGKGRKSDVREGYWKLSAGSHVIYYREGAEDKAVEIVRILHQRMDAQRHL